MSETCKPFVVSIVFLLLISITIQEVLQQIVESARQQFMKLGIRHVSMDMISGQLGISKKTLYQHIDSKDLLVELTIDRHIRQEQSLFSHLSRTSTSAIDEMIHFTKNVISIFNDLSPVLIHDLQKYYQKSWMSLRKQHTEFINNLIHANLQRGIKEKVYRRDMNIDVISRIFVENSWLLSDESVFPFRAYERDQLIKQFLDYHMHAILSEEGKRQFEKIKTLQ